MLTQIHTVKCDENIRDQKFYINRKKIFIILTQQNKYHMLCKL